MPGKRGNLQAFSPAQFALPRRKAVCAQGVSVRTPPDALPLIGTLLRA